MGLGRLDSAIHGSALVALATGCAGPVTPLAARREAAARELESGRGAAPPDASADHRWKSLECALEFLDPEAPCTPGETDARAFGSACHAGCDERGRWVVPTMCRPVYAGVQPVASFEPRSAVPSSRELYFLAHRTSQIRGRFYVIPFVAESELDIPRLGQARAEAAFRGLVDAGLCPEKLLVVTEAIVQRGEAVRLHHGRFIGVTLAPATPETARGLRTEGMAAPDPSR